MLTLSGPNPYEIEIGDPYVEFGATAADNYDGDLTAAISTDSSAVDTSLPGLYVVEYRVTDGAGNIVAGAEHPIVAQARRQVSHEVLDQVQ